MRGIVFTGERELELMKFPDPAPEAHDVVIEMKASGMCGSDLHQYRRPRGQTQASGIPMREGPVIAGHEPCGVVVALGSAVAANEAELAAEQARQGKELEAKVQRDIDAAQKTAADARAKTEAETE